MATVDLLHRLMGDFSPGDVDSDGRPAGRVSVHMFSETLFLLAINDIDAAQARTLLDITTTEAASAATILSNVTGMVYRPGTSIIENVAYVRSVVHAAEFRGIDRSLIISRLLP